MNKTTKLLINEYYLIWFQIADLYVKEGNCIQKQATFLKHFVE